jgi:hypothetical protein
MNNAFPDKASVERLRQDYPAGTRVELISMNDPYTELKPGDRGTVRTVDDIGTVFVNWDRGSGLGVAYGADTIRLVPTIPATVQSQIQAVRMTAATNMFAWPDVLGVAAMCDFDELVEWLPANLTLYCHYILTGETEARD